MSGPTPTLRCNLQAYSIFPLLPWISSKVEFRLCRCFYDSRQNFARNSDLLNFMEPLELLLVSRSTASGIFSGPLSKKVIASMRSLCTAHLCASCPVIQLFAAMQKLERKINVASCQITFCLLSQTCVLQSDAKIIMQESRNKCWKCIAL